MYRPKIFFTSTQYRYPTCVRALFIDPNNNQNPFAMNKTEVNHHDMHLKVQRFLALHAAETAGVAQVATLEALLDDLIDNVITQDGAATVDTSGTAEAKKAKRTLLTALFMHVVAGAKAHFTTVDDTEQLRIVDFTLSEVTALRDSELYTTLWNVYDTNLVPVAASLTGYNVTALQMTQLDTLLDEWRTLIKAPSLKIDQKVVAGHNVEELQAAITTLLDTRLDVVMDTFKMGNPDLVEGYYLARAIDDTGGSSAWIHSGTVDAGAGVATPTFEGAQGDTPLKLQNTGTADLSFQMLLGGAPVGAPKALSAGSTYAGLIGDLAPEGNAFKVENTDMVNAGTYKVTVG